MKEPHVFTLGQIKSVVRSKTQDTRKQKSLAHPFLFPMPLLLHFVGRVKDEFATGNASWPEVFVLVMITTGSRNIEVMISHFESLADEPRESALFEDFKYDSKFSLLVSGLAKGDELEKSTGGAVVDREEETTETYAETKR